MSAIEVLLQDRTVIPLWVAFVVTSSMSACAGDEGGTETGASAATQVTSASTSATSGVAATGDATEGGSDGSDASTTGSATAGSATTTASPTSSPTSATDTASTTGGGGGGGFCQEQCGGDADCRIDGVDDGYVCKEGRCRPETGWGDCTEDTFCQVLGAASFQLACESQADCSASRVCVAVEDYTTGACVTVYDPMTGCASNFEPSVQPLLEGGTAEVCVLDGVFCDPVGGLDFLYKCNAEPAPCEDDNDCAMFVTQPVCAGDGVCVCTDDSHCAGVPGLSKCVEGACACTEDADCDAVPGADACVDGLCGCSSAESCPAETVFDGTEPVCE